MRLTWADRGIVYSAGQPTGSAVSVIVTIGKNVYAPDVQKNVL